MRKFLYINYIQIADNCKYLNIGIAPIVKEITRLLAYKNDTKTDFYPKFEKIPQK